MECKNGNEDGVMRPKFAILTDDSNKVGRRVVAVEDLEPGELLFIEKSVFFVFPESSNVVACKQCGKPDVTVGCDRCRRYFCNDACAASELELHDTFCSVFSSIPVVASRFDVDAQLLAAVFEFALATLKTQERANAPVDIRDIRLDVQAARSLFAHSASSRQEWLASVTEAITALLSDPSASAISDSLTTSALVQFGQCINANAHAIVSASTPLGFGMFPLVAMLNHSCKPNCMYSCAPYELNAENSGKRGPAFLQVRVTSKVERGEELCVRYSDIYRSFNQRQQSIKADRFFTCACLRCQNIGAERELAGIRCRANEGCRGYVYLRRTESDQTETDTPAHEALTPWDPLDGIPACHEVLAAEDIPSAAPNASDDDSANVGASQTFRDVAYRVPLSGHAVCSCDLCGAELDLNHPALELCDRLEALIRDLPNRQDDPSLLAELEGVLKEASTMLHPMHVLLQQLYKAILNHVRPSRAGSKLCAQAADRAAICLTSAIMPARSLEAAAMLTTAAQIHHAIAIGEQREHGNTKTVLQRLEKAVKLQKNAVQHVSACLGPTDALVENYGMKLRRLEVTHQRALGK